MNLQNLRKNVNTDLASLSLVEKQTKEEKSKLQKLKENSIALTQARDIAQEIAQNVQQQAHDQIAKVVGLCLQSIFDGSDEYDFKIRFDRKRGKTEATLILLKNGHEIEDPLDADSGGVLDVAAFALRLSCIILTKPTVRKLIVLDEPFKFVSEEFRSNIKSLIEKLSKDFSIQFIMVTHIKELQAGKIITL